ncbi:hypothetical protein Tco_0838890 [Tanacetum coccineum]|uniref:Uncharacterized protein n=1 Tax=Tanacetum coccineum TaxID=301880 RepID=A0ABQ5ATA9_9ASTR
MSIFRVPMSVLRRLESIRSHFFNGRDPNSKRTSWLNGKNCWLSKEKGGLGVQVCIIAIEVLFSKWVWRFFTQKYFFMVKGYQGDHWRRLERGESSEVGTKLTQSSLDFSFRRKPRGGIEQEQYEALLVQVQDVNLVPVSDRWKWSLGELG